MEFVFILFIKITLNLDIIKLTEQQDVRINDYRQSIISLHMFFAPMLKKRLNVFLES